MAKMVSLKRPKSSPPKATDAPAEYTNPEDEGVSVQLDHHHLTKLGVGGDLKSGDKVEFHGHGKVERSETRSEGGEDRHSATLRLHKGAVDHEMPRGEPERDKADIRGDLEKSYAGVQTKALPEAGK